jgi:hypothetical protein
MRALFISLLLAIVLAACVGKGKNTPPKNLIPEDKFVDLMVEVHLIEASINQRFVKLVDSTDQSLSYYRFLFEKEGVAKADFDSTFAYYTRHPKMMNNVYEQVQIRLKAMAEDLQNNEQQYEAQEVLRDTVAE